jgi:hypothetical protein
VRPLLLAATVTLAACGPTDGPAADAPTRAPARARDDLARRYLVPLARAEAFARALGVTPTATFEPDPGAVLDLEATLGDFLRASGLPAAPRIAAALASYRRQFVGVEVDGRSYILGNFFRTDDDAQQPVAVDDGGETYFQIRYEPKTKRLSGLMVNGEG